MTISKLALWAGRSAAPVAVVASSLLVWQASQAAFNDTTENGTNNWAAGTVVISDDDAGTAMFNVGALSPGDTGTKCIEVDYDGSLAANVKLYAAASGGLGTYLNLTVQEGDGGSSSGCAGFTADSTLYTGTLAGFASSSSSYATGVGAFAPSGAGETKSYRFTYTVQNDNAAQGLSASATFTWEAQNS